MSAAIAFTPFAPATACLLSCSSPASLPRHSAGRVCCPGSPFHSSLLPPERIEEHRALVRLSTHGRHIVAAGSGHWIQFDEPELVVAAIREVVEHTRRRPV